MTVKEQEPIFFTKALDSIVKQRFVDYHIYLHLDGSPKVIRDIATCYQLGYPELITLDICEYRGRGQALKDVIDKYDDSEYICWVDSDDILETDAIYLLLSYLRKDGTQIGFSLYEQIDEYDRIICVGDRLSKAIHRYSWLLNFIPFHFRLMTRALYNNVGGINPRFSTIEDYELCLRIHEVAGFTCCPYYLYKHRLHKKNLSATCSLQQLELSKIAIEEAMKRRGSNKRLSLKIRSEFTIDDRED